jgi:hypothetical protein
MAELTEAQKRYESLGLKMMPVPEILDFCSFLQDLTPEQRIDALEFLQEAAHFCFECGRDLEIDERCHCRNDD